jgi:NTE family protein
MLNKTLGCRESGRTVALVLAGGAALGAYEAGTYAALHEAGTLMPTWLASSSIGTVNAAIIAGNEPEQRLKKLREFWAASATDPLPISSFWLGRPTSGPRRVAYNQAGALETILFGRPTIFRPRLSPGSRAGAEDVPALYDLDPLRRHLKKFVDFEILNSGSVRLSIATTDVVTGEQIVFDTAKRQVGPEHVIASCALLPVFAPVEVEGRLLGDGGLAANTPLDLILDDAGSGQLICFAVDLFAREGSRPQTLAASLSRAGDIAFGNQTRQILKGRQEEYRLREMIGRLNSSLPPEIRADPEVASILSEGRTENDRLFFLSYRAARDEAGPGKLFDFSRATLDDRWREGACAMQRALRELEGSPKETSAGLVVHEISADVR